MTGQATLPKAVVEADWIDANREDLSARVAVIAARLRQHASGNGDGEAERELLAAEERAARAAAAMPAASSVESVVAGFGLSPFERDVVLLCAGVELEGSFVDLCAEAQGDPHRRYPTFGLALAALPEAHWSAVAPGAPLRWWRLIELVTGDGPTTSQIRIDERVLHHLTGVFHLDERLHGLVSLVPSHDDLTATHHEVAAQVASMWSMPAHEDELPVIQLWGQDRQGAIGVAAHACHLIGLRLHRIRAADIPVAATERDLFVRLWEREAVLSRSALLVELDDHAPPDQPSGPPTVAALAEALHGVVAVVAREPLAVSGRASVRLHVARHTVDERRAIWTHALGPAAGALNGRLDQIVEQFDLGTRAITAASAHALGHLDAEATSGDGLADALWDACRSQARTGLDDLAQRIDAAATWRDLVLPDHQAHVLREVALHVRNRTTVYELWGFGEKSRRGLGISALFAGPSGTGKTMAAEVLANELRLDLYRIDLSQVVSKYIGETEKNLRRVFDAAEEGGAILLFDEADALFGKRSEVKDSHDRYANIEVSYLLQRMESYRGLAILTTNMKSALDGAFLRRIRFVVQFPFPDQLQRAEIWRNIFPAETPVHDLDFGGLSRLNVAGGNIRNIAMNAAFMAADTGQPVRMEHLLRAARAEYTKLEKPLTDAEVGGWA